VTQKYKHLKILKETIQIKDDVDDSNQKTTFPDNNPSPTSIQAFQNASEDERRQIIANILE